jgi:hypothetical protein
MDRMIEAASVSKYRLEDITKQLDELHGPQQCSMIKFWNSEVISKNKEERRDIKQDIDGKGLISSVFTVPNLTGIVCLSPLLTTPLRLPSVVPTARVFSACTDIERIR